MTKPCRKCAGCGQKYTLNQMRWMPIYPDVPDGERHRYGPCCAPLFALPRAVTEDESVYDA